MRKNSPFFIFFTSPFEISASRNHKINQADNKKASRKTGLLIGTLSKVQVKVNINEFAAVTIQLREVQCVAVVPVWPSSNP